MKLKKFLSGAALVAALVGMALFGLMPPAYRSHADGASSPSSYESPRIIFPGLTNGITANAIGTNGGFNVTLTAGQTITLSTNPAFALFKGRGFSWFPSVVTTTTGTTNTVVFQWKLGWTNAAAQIGGFTTTPPITNSMPANLSGTNTGFFLNAASACDNAGQAELYSIQNLSPNTIIVTNSPVSTFP